MNTDRPVRTVYRSGTVVYRTGMRLYRPVRPRNGPPLPERGVLSGASGSTIFNTKEAVCQTR